jgi:uncharacterized protein (DUF1015 family)
MARLFPFRALRPRPEAAAEIAAVPYDVVSVDEARALATGKPRNFLHVSRAEIDLAPGIDPHSDDVYRRAVENFEGLRANSLELEDEASIYFYRLRQHGRSQTGVAGCFSLDDYDRDVIKKHERTRRDKEDDRTRHMLALGAQTGPVFLTYKTNPHVDHVAQHATSSTPLFDFEAPDAVRHTVWRLSGSDRNGIVAAFRDTPALYIADGHHRAASAARARTALAEGSQAPHALGDGADYSTFLAVAFPHDQVHILPYNRTVKDLGGLTPADFLVTVQREFEVEKGSPSPRSRGTISMYFNSEWYALRSRSKSTGDRVSHNGFDPVLNIRDVRTDKRIDFVGGMKGPESLARLVDSGQAAVAFSLYPVSVEDLMTVSDHGAIMPPKSTWFEPKLRDGLLIHLI